MYLHKYSYMKKKFYLCDTIKKQFLELLDFYITILRCFYKKLKNFHAIIPLKLKFFI